MGIIFRNSENSKTSCPYRPLLNKDTYVVLSSLGTHYK